MKDDTEVRNAIKATWLNEAGATPFLRASLCGDVKVMELLLKHGADPKIPTDDGTTALAALSGVGFTKGFMQDLEGADTSVKAIKLLIASGIDVNAANKDKVTALHGAAHKNFVEAIQLLADNGADLHRRESAARHLRTQQGVPRQHRARLGVRRADGRRSVCLSPGSRRSRGEAAQGSAPAARSLRLHGWRNRGRALNGTQYARTAPRPEAGPVNRPSLRSTVTPRSPRRYDGVVRPVRLGAMTGS